MLNVRKDRHGGLREHCPDNRKEPMAGVFEMRVELGMTSWAIWPGKGDEAEESDQDVEIIDALSPSPSSVRDVKARLNWSPTGPPRHSRRGVPGTFLAFPRNKGQGKAETVPVFLSP